MKTSPAKINSLLWIEKAANLPVVLAASKGFFFEVNVVHLQSGILVNARALKRKKRKHNVALSIYFILS